MSGLRPDQVAAIKAETRGEIVRWAGKPDAGQACLATSAIYLMAIPWSAVTFTVFGALLAAAWTGPPDDRPAFSYEYAVLVAALLFSGSFAALGLGMLLTPLWAFWRARQTVYAITDRRVVTIIAGPWGKVSSIAPERVVRLERRDGRKGRGTLRIITGYSKDSDGDTVTEAEELHAVPAVRQAESLVERLRRNHAEA